MALRRGFSRCAGTRPPGYDWPQLQQHSLVIEPTLVHEAMQLLKAGGHLSVADTVALMQATYRGLVVESAPVFARWFALLLEDERPWSFTALRAKTAPAGPPPCCCTRWA